MKPCFWNPGWSELTLANTRVCRGEWRRAQGVTFMMGWLTKQPPVARCVTMTTESVGAAASPARTYKHRLITDIHKTNKQTNTGSSGWRVVTVKKRRRKTLKKYSIFFATHHWHTRINICVFTFCSIQCATIMSRHFPEVHNRQGFTFGYVIIKARFKKIESNTRPCYFAYN